MGPPIKTVLAALCASYLWVGANAQPLGLPPLHIPADNPQTPGKIALGDKLFNDKRFSSTGDVSCATCHDPQKAFHLIARLSLPKGISNLEGHSQRAKALSTLRISRCSSGMAVCWTLEDQAQHPTSNPVEMGLRESRSRVEGRAQAIPSTSRRSARNSTSRPSRSR